MGSRKRKNKRYKTRNIIKMWLLVGIFILVALAGLELSFRKFHAEHLGELTSYDVNEKQLTIFEPATQYKISVRWDEETKFLEEGTPSTFLSLALGKEVNAKYHDSLLTMPVAKEICVHEGHNPEKHR